MTNHAVLVAKGQACGVCKELIEGPWSSFDTCLRQTVCGECRNRMTLAVGYLAAAGLKKCIQVSNGKPIMAA